MINQVNGVEAEEYVKSYFRSQGFIVHHIDDYYDIEIEKDSKRYLIEIKSCQFRIKDGKQRTRYGRFQFDKKSSRERQRTNNVWIVFVLNYSNGHEIIGVKSARALKQRCKFLNLNSLMNQQVYHIDTFCSMLSTGRIKNSS